MIKKKFSKKNKLKIRDTLSKVNYEPLEKIEEDNPTAPYVIAIGASAGGLETLKTFFNHAQTSNNMAFVVITHLSPDHVSMLPELIQQYTFLKVVTIHEGDKIEGNHVYVLPPSYNVFVQNGLLHLVPQKEHEVNLPIDFFLRTLAHDQGSKAICIILSGTGSDGTIGLRALRERNGLVIVQSAKSARYDGMPKSAISTGLVDYILPPEEMYEFLTKYLAHAKDKNINIEKSISDEIQQILLLLHNQTGHDFSAYKSNTIFRRIQKRMNILQIDALSQYIKYLHKNAPEVSTLFKELLINLSYG